jgi:hypothetical protein
MDTQVAEALITEELKQGIEVMNIHSIASGASLSNAKQYPRFTRLVTSSTYMASSLALLFKVFGFSHCVYLVAQVYITVETRDIFLEYAEKFGIKVVTFEFES